MFGYVYLTTNKVNGKRYIGRRTSNQFLGNQYLGSGVHLNKAIKKYGKENFSVEFIESTETLKDLIELERYFIRLADAVRDEGFYNSSYGGPQEGWTKGDGNIAKREDIRKINREKHLGKKMSPEFVEKQRQIHKGKPSGMKGHKQTDYCKKITSETTKNYNLTKRDYKKISKSKIGNKMIKKDGKCIRVRPEQLEQYLLNGWELGGLSRKGKYVNRHQSKPNTCTTKGKVAINNGIINTFVDSSLLEKYLCEGWTKGLKKRNNP